MKAFFLSVFLFAAFICFACLNEHHVTKYGKESIDGFTLYETHFYKKHNTVELETYLNDLKQRDPKTEQSKFENENSIAVTLIKLGRLDEAEKILNKLYEDQPKDYSVVINLGTLYELQGKNQKALEYIKRAVGINPDSHSGSEWFHIKVLEFKLKNLPDNKIPGTDILQIHSIKKSAEDIAGEIKYQLEERIPFTPAPNLMMAKILDEYAAFLADSVSLQGGYLMYDIAADYDRNDVLKLSDKKTALRPYFKKYNERLPVTGNYYLDGIITAVDDNKASVAASLLDKGLTYLKEQEEKKREEERNKQYLLWGTAAGVIIASAGFIIYRRRKRVA